MGFQRTWQIAHALKHYADECQAHGFSLQVSTSVCVCVCVFQVELLCEESLPSNYPPTHLPTVPHSLCQATALSCSLVSRHGSDVGAECFQCTVVSAWLWDPVWDLVTLRDLKQIQMKDCCTRSGQQQNRHQNLDVGICMCARDFRVLVLQMFTWQLGTLSPISVSFSRSYTQTVQHVPSSTNALR